MQEDGAGKRRWVKVAALAALVVAAVGVGMMTGILPGWTSRPASRPERRLCADCGVIASIHAYPTQSGAAHRADAGKPAGRPTEKDAMASTRYGIMVRMDDGTVRIITAVAAPRLNPGDRVRVINGTIVRKRS